MTRSAWVIACGMTRLHSRTRSGLQAAVGLLAVAVLVASCGSSDSVDGGSSTTSSQAAAVLDAYRASQTAFDQAIEQAAPTLPALAQTMTGSELQSVRRALVTDQVDGIVGQGSVQLHPKLISQRGDEAVVHDCLFSTLELVYSSTGKPVPPVTPPEHDGVDATVLKVSSGVWKVATEAVTDGSCPAGY